MAVWWGRGVSWGWRMGVSRLRGGIGMGVGMGGEGEVDVDGDEVMHDRHAGLWAHRVFWEGTLALTQPKPYIQLYYIGVTVPLLQ